MRIIGTLAALALVMGIGAPAFAQKSALPATACDAAMANLKDTRAGGNDPKGVEASTRLKPENGYKTSSDGYLFVFDGYREFGDVRANCAQEKWPAEVKVAALKRTIHAAVAKSPATFCGSAAPPANTAPSLIQTWLANPEIRGFEDRRLELQNQLDPFDARHDTAQRHVFDADWLRDAASELAAACKPNDKAKEALAAAEKALSIAKENAAFVSCNKAKGAMQPQIAAVDAAAKDADVAAIKAAVAALETAAAPVKAACAGSEEGLGDINYTLAAKHIAVLLRESPGCQAAAVAMNNARMAINSTTDKSQIPAAVVLLRQAGKDAKAACGDDPALETWANFIAWVAERNLTRLP